jgi:putative ABC transport system ATP-binding protein
MASEPVIQLSDVDFSYRSASRAAVTPHRPDFALHIPTLSLACGEHAACIGPSGSGKTTLVNLIAGIVNPSRGTVRTLGVDISVMKEPARRAMRCARIGMVFQEFELLEYMSAMQNILLAEQLQGADLRATEHSELEARAHALAAAAGISHTLQRKPARLSQGERQRVALCRALVTQPQLILCDEPTGNLDPVSTVTVLDLLFSQAAASGASVLMVTHNHSVLDRFSHIIDMAAFVQRVSPLPEGAA